MVINLKDPNKDVEETKNLELVKKALLHNKVERFCLDLFIEATDGNTSEMMTMLDMFAAKIIHKVAKRPKSAVMVHARHVLEALDLLEAMKEVSSVDDLLNTMKEKDDENKSNKSN